MRKSRHTHLGVCLVVLGIGACGGGDGDGAAADAGGSTTQSDPTLATGPTGVDLAGYPTKSTMGTNGGTLALPGGPTLTVPPATLADSVTVGMRPAATAPVVGAPGYTVLSSWFELGTSAASTTAKAGLLTLDIPATVPSEAVGHPGLHLLAVVGGVTFPIDGTFDAATGQFRVELTDVPATFTFALAFNANVQKLASDEVTGALDRFERARDGVGTPWSTLDFWLVFDGTAVKMDAAKQVLAWARAAANTYSDAGFKEPFLRKETIGAKSRWYIHMTTDGSYFSEGNAADGGLFGRQYMSALRIASPLTDPLGSGKASIAHEMFHAIFRAYGVPTKWLCDAGKCRRTSSGINEGMATAAGYFIDQGSPAKPRSTESPRPLSWSFGWFDRAAPGTMYMNQDFYVYLLRVGSLGNFRMQLDALTAAALPATGTLFDVLAAYHAALDAGQTGFGGNFSQTWAWYIADRAFARSPDGWLWPNEPAGGTPGAPYVFDPTLWSQDSMVQLTDGDCVSESARLDCSLLLDPGRPLAPLVFTAKVDALKLPSALAGKPLTGSFDAIVSGGNAVFTVFGEKAGKGSASAAVRSPDGMSVTLANVGTDYPTVRMIVIPAGTATPRTMVEMSFAGETAAKVWVLCEGVDGTQETYGCIPWDGDLTFSSASDECLYSGDYLTSNGEFSTRAACAAKCVSTAEATGWRVCETPS